MPSRWRLIVGEGGVLDSCHRATLGHYLGFASIRRGPDHRGLHQHVLYVRISCRGPERGKFV